MRAIQEEERASADPEELSRLQAESDRWQTLYEELQAKVEPFQDQLDAFEAEKNALLSQTTVAQGEMKRLADQYANLLGHQNQKQKIRHVQKLQQENVKLKQEVTKLREESTKHKRQTQKLQDKLNRQQGVRRFDPSKAFKHKENADPAADNSMMSTM
ncbi:hyaluronan-mediated motility receptor-like [Branchiostoma floridae]|uniref:Hyaluronan-mediated motility receptor-like n=2 Tax=Branchiostoma floridae TaxID=7739 RepID=A0A9J7LHQ1_BRAFL|nr:hyaluronan-mediated motility receptor-like [Branchiostoma floridae]